MGYSGYAWFVMIQAGRGYIPIFYLDNFKGCRHIMRDRHGLYRCQWLSSAFSRATCLFLISWATLGTLGLL
jgi:hypothetical protein